MLTNLGSIVGGTKDEFWRAVVSGANVRNIGLVFNENFGTAEVAELENAAVWVEQQVLGLNVTMTDALRVDIGKSTEQLINIELDFEDRHGSLHLVEKSRSSVNCLGDKFLHQIEVYFIFLRGSQHG